MAITTGILTGGSNSHQTTSEEANGAATDFASPGVVGTLTNTSGVAPATGGFAVNAQGSPDMTVAVSTGVAYITATPTSQGSQKLRVKNSASANVTISANSSGSTKYDWLYLSVSATNAANPNSAADNVTTLTTSRSSSATSDDGTPPTYGLHIATITVANGASSISNGNIADSRVQAGLGSAVTAIADAFQDFVESGCVWTADAAGSTRVASMTSGYVWLSGQRLTVAAVSARTFTASKDVYVDLSNNGDGTAAFTYTDNTTNAASPALTAGSLRLAIVVVGATNIATTASINQGQEDRILPIASSIAYTVTDSLGNMICPRDPNRTLIGYRQITSDFVLSASQTTQTQVTGLSCPVIIPTSRKVKITVTGDSIVNASASQTNNVQIWDGTVVSGTSVGTARTGLTTAGGFNSLYLQSVVTPSTSSKTYNVGVASSGSTNVTINAGSGRAASIKVELI